MNIGAQTLRPNVFYKHLVPLKHQKKKTKRVLVSSLSLTSMVDMFSLLVIFLLQTFSTSPEMLFVTKGVTLPSAKSGAEILDAPVLSITNNEIFLDQKSVGSVSEITKNPEVLLKKLEILRENWQKTHPNEKFKGEINVQAHRDTSSAIISQVMGFLPSQHFGSIQLIVMAGGGA